MALLTVKASKKIDATLKLEESTAKMIDRYAAFLNVSADEVVEKGMEYIFTKDKDFQQHLDKQPDFHVPASLRIKKAPGTPTAMKNGNRNGAKSVASDAK
ncbi:hypothetical protein [Tunturiibacter gelidoferens]|uniref:Uncharacterized protein n=1 Tax=Tunturiibacter gelidiferens TaxID=3069689 RepID=A0ACC5P5P0_9BACT|nr:hypothetical protein [Edaphobacter lichenicola]MBB5342024.1 hypothetical protein [Edaphobacter lichenicola]